MKRKKLFIATFVFAVLTIVIFIGDNEILKKEKTYITSIFANKVMTGNTITSLDTPTDLSWNDNSAATVTWSQVTNANYYNVILYLYNDNNELLNLKETGTSSNELDVQHEINYMMNEKNIDLKSFKVSFEIIALYIYDNETIMSEKSNESPKKQFEIGTGAIKISQPVNISVDDDYNATWVSPEGVDYYWLTFSLNGSYTSLYGVPVFLSPSSNYSYGTTINGVFKANIRKAISEFYNDMVRAKKIQSGQTVELKIKVQANPSSSSNSNYIASDISEYSNSFSYSDSEHIVISTPTNINVDDDYNVTWTSSEGVGYYRLTFSLNGSYISLYGEPVFLSPSSNYSYGTTINGVFKANIKKAISEFYNDMVRIKKVQIGQTVELKIKVQAKPSSSSNSNYIASDISEYSNSFSYSNSELIKISTPTNISVDDDYNATWTPSEGVDHYRLTFSLNGSYISLYGEPVFLSSSSNYSYGTTINGVFKANIKKAISEFYNDMVKAKKIQSGQTVELKIKVQANPSSNGNYIASDTSEYSNIFYNNSDGSTKINNIFLSPNNPVIAVGRSIYIGKTIEPNNALYNNIRWSTSNNSVVTITDMGKITGIIPGTATITAKINNATQTAEVNVYEISSNIQNSTDSQNVINKANDVIEAVVADGDISNTDITNENKDAVLNEIKTGAQNCDLFNVDIKTNQPSQVRINELQSEVSTNYSDYSIVGATDVNIAISHKDSNGTSHHIANITELENKIGVTFDLSNSIPELVNTKIREYKLLRKHNNNLDDIDFEINNGIVDTSSDKFSQFILLYKDTDIPVTGINLNKESTTIIAGNSETITVTVLPENAANKNYTSVSGDESIVTVVNNVITAVAPGTTTVTFTSVDGNYSKSITVEVIKPLISISLNKTSGTLNVGETENLIVIYNPIGTTDNKTVTWTSSDDSIATVNSSGKVTALAPGKATITAKVGAKTATYILTVVGKETLQEVFVKNNYSVKNEFVHGFTPGRLLNDIKTNLGLNCIIVGNSTIVATGIQIKYNTEIFTIVVYGDLTGDGKINSADLLKMRQHLLGTSTLVGAYKEAGSIATGKTINSADLLRIRQHLLGQRSIEQ